MTPLPPDGSAVTLRTQHSFLRRIPAAGAATGSGLLRAAVELSHSPLTRNGYALAVNAALTSLLGLVFWVLAARLYPATEVGIGSALISSLITLSAAAQLNLGNVLNRFVPVAGPRTGTLILFAYGVGTIASLLIAGIFLLGVGRLVPHLAFLTETWRGIWLVAAVAAWTVFALQDSVLAGLRQAIWVPLENTAHSIAKIGLLVLFAGTGAGFALFAAWTLPLLLLIAFVNWFIIRRALPRLPAPDSSSAFHARDVARFFGWDNLGSLAMAAATGLAPLIVVNLAGPVANAHYYLAWTIAHSLYLVSRGMGVSLLAEGATDRIRLPTLTADALVHTMIPLSAVAILVTAGAPLIMGIFGGSYAAEGTTVLRVLVVASLLWSVVTIYLAHARAEGRVRSVASVQGGTLLVVLVLGAALAPQLGALGMAIAWLAAHSLALMGICAVGLVKCGPSHVFDWPLRLASALAHFVALLQWRPIFPLVHDPAVRSLLQSTGEPAAADWQPLLALSSRSDVLSVFLGKAHGQPDISQAPRQPEGARALVKTAVTREGIATLERHCRQVAILSADPRATDCGFQLPEILAVDRNANSIRIIERIIRGEDGRRILARRDVGQAALRSAAVTVARLHQQTAEIAVIGDAWLDEWVDSPVRAIAQARATPMLDGWRNAGIAVFRKEQHAFWRGQALSLGWSHGDLSPGNIIFATREETDAETPQGVAVEGIVDWAEARPNAPSGFDACHLALTARMLCRGEELGLIVRDLLSRPRWTPDELAWLAIGEGNHLPNGWPCDPPAIRAIIGLAWLQHVAGNLAKSQRYQRSRLWIASNVDRILLTYARDFGGVSK